MEKDTQNKNLRIAKASALNKKPVLASHLMVLMLIQVIKLPYMVVTRLLFKFRSFALVQVYLH